jgi:hypothetical protein
VLDTSFKVESIEMGSGVNIERDSEWVVKDITVSKIRE